MYLPYTDKFVISSEEDMIKLVEAGFDIQNAKKTGKAVYYRVADVASCVVEASDDTATYMCSDRFGRRFLLIDETGRFMKIEVNKEVDELPPLTRDKPVSPGWYRRFARKGERYEAEFVRVDREIGTKKLTVKSVDGVFDYLEKIQDNCVWGVKPEKTTFN